MPKMCALAWPGTYGLTLTINISSTAIAYAQTEALKWISESVCAYLPHPIPGCPQRKSNLFYFKIWHCKFEESVGVARRGATVWRGCGSADLVGPLAFANLPSIGLLVRRAEDASSLSLLGVSFVGFRASLVLISLVAH